MSKIWASRPSPSVRAYRRVHAGGAPGAPRARQVVRSEFTQIVEQMSNRERTKWAQSGSPGLTNQDVVQAASFLAKLRARSEPARHTS